MGLMRATGFRNTLLLTAGLWGTVTLTSSPRMLLLPGCVLDLRIGITPVIAGMPVTYSALNDLTTTFL